MTPSVSYLSFPAMNTTVELTGVGVADRELVRAAGLVPRLVAEWERRFSRFRPDSQLSRLNAANGEPFNADDSFLDLLETAVRAVRRTSGRFDPSVLPALEALGYDRGIDQLKATPPPSIPVPEPLPGAGVSAWDLVQIDRGKGQITLPPGMRIDLGGIAKGAFADLLAAEFAAWPGGSVDAGGDLVVWGETPDGTCWTIGIEDPSHPDRDSIVIQLPESFRVGIATSGTHRRRWRAGDRALHHLIDPRTGLPVSGGTRSVTALAPTATAAEIAAKAVLIAANAPPLVDLFGASVTALLSANGHVDLLTHAASENDGMAPLTSVWRAA
jgi:thiamine biosynthesis lipoprotein